LQRVLLGKTRGPWYRTRAPDNASAGPPNMGDRRFFCEFDQDRNEANPFAAYRETCYNANNLNENGPILLAGWGPFPGRGRGGVVYLWQTIAGLCHTVKL
jgi:hypothetical protein